MHNFHNSIWIDVKYCSNLYGPQNTTLVYPLVNMVNLNSGISFTRVNVNHIEYYQKLQPKITASASNRIDVINLVIYIYIYVPRFMTYIYIHMQTSKMYWCDMILHNIIRNFGEVAVQFDRHIYFSRTGWEEALKCKIKTNCNTPIY